jgi:hypothetical protein
MNSNLSEKKIVAKEIFGSKLHLASRDSRVPPSGFGKSR